MVSFLNMELMDGPGGKGLLYYIACALLFLLVGLFIGYLIWKRGVLQTIDLEADNNLSERALKRLEDELKEEDRVLSESGGSTSE